MSLRACPKKPEKLASEFSPKMRISEKEGRNSHFTLITGLYNQRQNHWTLE